MKQLLAIFGIALICTGSSAQTNHQVNIAFSNSQCRNDTSCVGTKSRAGKTVPPMVNCLCDAEVWRAQCPNAGSCPDPTVSVQGYTLLPNTNHLTATVTATGTSWTYNDIDTAALLDGLTFKYAVDNRWTDQTTASDRSAVVTVAPVVLPVASTTHSATLNYSSTACTTGTPCWIQLWRATCTSPTSCPTYVAGSSGWVSPPNLQFPVWNETTSGTTWQFVDNDPALQASTTYAYVATVCFQPGGCNGNGYSPPSQPWSGTTTGVQPPPAPNNGANTIY